MSHFKLCPDQSCGIGLKILGIHTMTVNICFENLYHSWYLSSFLLLFLDEKEKKTSVAFNDLLTNRMQVEEGNVPFKGSSKLSSSKSKIKLLVGGIVFVILIIIIIVLMLPKTIKQNDCKYILSTSVPKVAFLQEVFSLSMPSVCPRLTTVDAWY